MAEQYHNWRCEICEEIYHTRQEAEKCEARSQPTLVIPRGLVFQCDKIIPLAVFVVKCDGIIGHHHSLECWTIINPADDIGESLKVVEFEKDDLEMEGVDKGDVRVVEAIKFLEGKGVTPTFVEETGG